MSNTSLQLIDPDSRVADQPDHEVWQGGGYEDFSTVKRPSNKIMLTRLATLQRVSLGGARIHRATALGVGVLGAATASALALSQPSPAWCKPSSSSKGEISTHVISKLGKQSVEGALVRVYYNSAFDAGPLSPGWTVVSEAALSANGGIDDLVPPGKLQKGLYMLEFDFAGVDAAARQIYRKTDALQNDDHNSPSVARYVALNPSGFFLAAKSTLTLKIEDEDSLNHL